MSKESNTNKEWLMLFLKGAGMGAADVVPGVSGGTIAFITGIYERLLGAIKSIDIKAVKLLFGSGIKAFWQHIDGTFLVVLFGGLLTSIVSLAKLITFLLENHPLFVWSFFFGLIIASVIHIGRQIESWDGKTIASLLIGAGVSFWITSISPAEANPDAWFYAVSGAIAITAMILPGISGSFILLLMGMYGHVLAAVTSYSWDLLALFLAGCVFGLIAFSRLLSWLLARFHQVTFALLTGFLIGSLNALWPWKEVVTSYTNSKGIEKPLMQQNIMPSDYGVVSGQDPNTLVCIGLMLTGLLLILLLEKLTEDKV